MGAWVFGNCWVLMLVDARGCEFEVPLLAGLGVDGALELEFSSFEARLF